MYFDYIIIGSGFYGLTLAERITTETDKSVMILEQRNYIGEEFQISGLYNNKDPKNRQLINDNHIFLTNMEHVWRYLENFSDWKKINIKGSFYKYVAVPELGYAHMFKNMLGTKTKIMLNVDNFQILKEISYKKIIYSEKQDCYFHHKLGGIHYSIDKSVDTALKYFYREL
ncbi:UDP-galactopyranose mutase [Hathewaya histolytica]|uniref:UDP-galactopyranose mutase n=1 Tax=Hathewaya histolytica TaxID=1498 RepID=UPI003B67F9DB